MKKIASFCVDHDVLLPGVYLSRRDGTADTYDVRMKRPNSGNYLDGAEAHTIEHLFATYARNSALSDHVIYVGPMGCLTGFYLITEGLDDGQVLELIRESFRFVADFEGDIPVNTSKECGNYQFHNLPAAKRTAAEYCKVLAGLTVENMRY